MWPRKGRIASAAPGLRKYRVALPLDKFGSHITNLPLHHQ
jgi:hypothetical protein